MSTTDTRARIEELVFKTLATLGPDPEDISLEATLEQLDVDSLDLAELSQVVEDEVGVALKGSDAATIKTVGDAVDLITARL